MEFYSKKMNKMLVIALVGIMSIFVGACTSDALDDANALADNAAVKDALVKNADGTETVILSNGEQIVLEDTTTYVINFDNINMTGGFDDTMVSRGILYTGYDREAKPKDYKKYLLGGLEKYGINPTTVYIGKFITYYKDLPVSKGYSLLPSNSKYANENSMGFNPPSLNKVGFHTTIPDTWNGYETGVTQIFYVNCDISGIYWNRNVPCNPDDLIWYFRSIADE
mgnify:FL=1